MTAQALAQHLELHCFREHVHIKYINCKETNAAPVNVNRYYIISCNHKQEIVGTNMKRVSASH